jgi:polysaccharide biosynthesis protein VpsM
MKRGVRRVATLAMLAAGTSANAQEAFDSSRASAGVLFSTVYTDNFYYDTSAGEPTAAMGGIIAPSATYKGTKGRLDVLATLNGEFASFDTPGSADDYEDGKVALATSWLATRRGRLDLRGYFQRSHDPFGINRTEDATVRDDELDIWHAMEVGTLFHYGAPEATLNAEVGLSALRKDYQTNEAETRFLNYDSTSLQYTLFYNFSPKTATLFDFVRKDVQFDEAFGGVDDRSGEEYQVRTGFRWLATAKTSGDIRLGVFRREFDDSDFTEQGFDWKAGVQWAPRPRTLLDFDATRSSQESYRADTRVNITRSLAAGWKQYWGARLNSKLTALRSTIEFVGQDREDTLYNLRVAVDYSLSRRLSAVLTVDSFQRDSNEPTSEFDRFSAYAGVRLDF